MKKLFTMMGVVAFSVAAMAQSVITHSVYDVNQNGEISVTDAVSVIQATLQSIDPVQTPQYVTAEDLAILLQDIQSDLALIKEKLGITSSEGGSEEGGNDPYNGHDYVDLGVVVDGKPIYWATTNIGAELPADYGLYFAWGETVGYTGDTNDGRKFDWASYSSDLCGGDYNKMKKYCTDSDYGTVDNKTVLDPEDDAAHVNWQGAWRMPTKEEQDALRTQCSWMWATMTNSAGKSVYGYKVSNKTDSSKYIFLPAAGYRVIGVLESGGSLEDLVGDYWSSSLSTTSYSYDAICLGFSSDGYDWYYGNRSYGYSVRPVCQ